LLGHKKNKTLKINWGTGIAISISIFVIFIILMIIGASKQNFDLVTEDYYPKELEYQQEIDALKKANSLKEKIEIIINENIEIRFPKNWNADSVKGDVLIYRPSDKTKDHLEKINLDSANRHLLYFDNLDNGKYIVNIDFSYLGDRFKVKQDVVLYK